jgi:hypothetical protein
VTTFSTVSRARLRHATVRASARTGSSWARSDRERMREPRRGAPPGRWPQRGKGGGYCPTPGRRQCRALSGGSPDGRAADAGRLSPLPLGRWWARRNAALGTASAESGRGPSSVPGILSPRKITVKGAPSGRVAKAMAQAPPLSSDLPRQVLGTYRKDGAE